MRSQLITILLLCYVVHSTAQSPLDKKLDFSINNELLDEALLQLSLESQVNISYRNRLLPKKHFVTVSFSNERLETILQAVLQNTNLDYKIVSNQIVLYRRPPPQKPKFTISGYIEDADTGEKLIGAALLDLKTGNGSSTNNYGFYSLTLEEGTTTLYISYLGYEPRKETFELNKDKPFNIILSSSLELPEIIVTANDSTKIIEQFTDLSKESINPALIKALPSLGGEADVLRISYLLPGIQTGADGVGGLQVRGGSNDQNLVLLDGATIYNPTHAIGVFSIFNSDAIKSVSILKGNFPARYGGRLSSVIDIRMKEGNQMKWAGETTIGLISGKVALEGPIIKEKMSCFLSFRRSLTDLYARPITERISTQNNPNQKGFSDYSFYDLNGKINIDFSDKDKLFLSVYAGEDDFYNNNELAFSLGEVIVSANPIETANLSGIDTDTTNLKWGNKIGALRWNHLFNNKLFANSSITYSEYDFDSNERYKSLGFYSNGYEDKIISNQAYQSKITNLSAKVDLEYIPSSKDYIRFGIAATRHVFQPGASSSEAIFIGLPFVQDSLLRSFEITSPPQESYEYNAYIEDEMKISDAIYANVGVHITRWQTENANYNYLQPRLHLKVLLSKKISLGLSYSQMVQPLHLLTTSNIGLPGDIWVPSTDRIAPQEAWQADGNLQYLLSKQIELGVASYYKKSDNVITFLEQDSLLLLDASDWESQVAVGEGWAYGFEFSLKKQKGKTKGWLSYTLSWSERQFDEINQGLRYPFRYDRRHSAKAALIHQLNDRISLNANFLYETGIAVTLPLREFIIAPNTEPIPIASFRNGVRLPNSHRLDIGLVYKVKKKWGEHVFNVGVYNVYNQQNPLFIRLRRNPEIPSERQYVQVTLLPILPSLSYTIKF